LKVTEKRKHLPKKLKIHFHLKYGYFVAVKLKKAGYFV